MIDVKKGLSLRSLKKLGIFASHSRFCELEQIINQITLCTLALAFQTRISDLRRLGVEEKLSNLFSKRSIIIIHDEMM